MSRRSKGRDFEKKAQAEMEAEGWVCWRPSYSKYGVQDILGNWDMLCVKDGKELKFIQVKSGNVSGGMKKLKEKLSKDFLTHKPKLTAELWEWKKLKSFKGWRKTDVIKD